jgi:hypothetical protein
MKSNLSVLIKTINNAPLWIKEVIFHDLKAYLSAQVPGILDIPADDIYSLTVPEITFKGKKELETREHVHELNIYKYLTSACNQLRVVDITLNNFWNLEESSRFLARCIKSEYIKVPASSVVQATIYYMANEIRLGEYIKRINIIDVNQLEAALRKQKEVSVHSYQKLGDVLQEMELVTDRDLSKILQIKDESQKRFMLPPDSSSDVKQNGEMQERIDKLTQENTLLKEKLRAVFNIQNKAGNQ